MTQKQSRKKIELLKEELAVSLQNDILRFKRAVIRELDYLWREAPSSVFPKGETTIEKFADFILQRINLPKGIQREIINELKNTQMQIAEVHDQYFKNTVPEKYKPVDYEKMLAAYSIDFPQIDKDVRDTVVKTFRESVRNEYSFETIRTNLQKESLGTSQIYTLANTAVAQFDNASMFEFAQQAGVEKYLYDGTLTPNSRPFCVKHFKKTYTLERIHQLNNGQELEVWTSCGGFNCTHFWTAQII